jgi:hypothetical protein
MKQFLMGFGAVILLVGFAAIGIAHIFKPDYFINRSAVRKGGDMLSESNRISFQIAGAIFAAFAIYLLYIFLRG